MLEFSNGQSALDHALRSPPALVLTDVMMPLMDGKELLQALRNHPATSLVPVVFLSALASVEARSAALEQGADDFLVRMLPVLPKKELLKLGIRSNPSNRVN